MSLNSLQNRIDDIANNLDSNRTTEERVVLTPLNKTKERTVLLVERKTVDKLQKDKLHFAGGDHTGIVINKQKFAENINQCATNYHLSLQFVVFLCDAASGIHSQESRTLRFEFSRIDFDYTSIAQQFFREIVEPREFPRDYVGFIKKIMKLLQNGYEKILKVEIELKKMQDLTEPLNRLVSHEDIDIDRKQLTEEKALEMIESSFPNPVTAQSIKKDFKFSDELENVVEILKSLETRGLIKSLENNAYTRAQHLDDVQIVKKIPHLNADKQPTIAIITAQYCEKLAVDSMIDNKETFVRFTTIGESNIYTLGTIGKHRVVSTKLPTIGHTREAMTAAGNTTTRLLGTFQKVDYIFLVGVAGGVPHFTDYNRHVRLGDVVISGSISETDSSPIYLYANSRTISNASIDINSNLAAQQQFDFEVKSYSPTNFYLQKIARKVKENFESDTNNFSDVYKTLLTDGGRILKKLQSQHNFDLPSADSDKLFMSIGEKDMIQISHPNPDSLIDKKIHGLPRLHLTPLASGRIVAKDDQIRQFFATKNNVFAFDCEFDTVIESIIGNCRDSFILIRGISDYKDGTCGKEWQPYASLVAAVVMKMVISAIPDPICE